MRRVLVLGLGRFGGGAAVARWFRRRGDEVLVTDLRGREVFGDVPDELEEAGIRLRFSENRVEDADWADTVAVNPAVPFGSPLVKRARARGAEISTELGLTLDLLEGPVLAVTGTNGKTTTASLAFAMLQRSGVPAILGGNMGRPLLEVAGSLGRGTVAVLEISSFQLAWLEHGRLAPRAAVVTNVTEDHLDRHGSFSDYVAAKRKLAESVPEKGTLVLCEDDAVCRSFAEGAKGRVVWFGRSRPPPVDLSGLRLLGAHNAANAAAAAHAALACGAAPEGCALAAAEFTGVRHRLEAVAEIGGVQCVDDAVSTTPVATAAAVSAFDRPVVLLCGGKDKGLDPAPLLEAARGARAVVVYGAVGPELAAALPGAHRCGGFDEAVERGLALARPGEILLLSPGFSSYDEFPGFDARGARFRAILRSRGAVAL